MSITTALKARREQLRDREAGFTLIELLVVVIIIGILAAIAIPVYIGVQNSAKDTATQSDLTNAKIAVNAAYSASSSSTWTAISSTASTNVTSFGNYGWTSSSAVDATKGTQSATNWCIKQTSASATTNVYYVTPVDSPTLTKNATYCV